MQKNTLSKYNSGNTTIGIAIATYNGADYIIEQLDSIRKQNVKPENVLISDDKSTDNTISIVRNYIYTHKLENWSVKINKNNLGYIDNFLNAAKNLNNDIIFFCDQDDIWLPDKIQSAFEVFMEHEDALVVSCDAGLIDGQGKAVRTLQTSLRVQREGLKRISLEEQASSLLSSGLTLAIRRNFLLEMYPIIKKYSLTHDSPMGLFAAARDGFYRIGKMQVLHRVHTSNTSKPTYFIQERMSHRERHIEGRIYQVRLLRALGDCEGFIIEDRKKEDLKREIIDREKSIQAMREKRLGYLLKSIFRSSKMKNEKVEIVNFIVTLLGRG